MRRDAKERSVITAGVESAHVKIPMVVCDNQHVCFDQASLTANEAVQQSLVGTQTRQKVNCHCFRLTKLEHATCFAICFHHFTFYLRLIFVVLQHQPVQPLPRLLRLLEVTMLALAVPLATTAVLATTTVPAPATVPTPATAVTTGICKRP